MYMPFSIPLPVKVVKIVGILCYRTIMLHRLQCDVENKNILPIRERE